jgi:hypothetical protein
MIGLMTPAALVSFVSVINKKLVTILNRDMQLVMEELVDQILAPRHYRMVPQVVANINSFKAKTKKQIRGAGWRTGGVSGDSLQGIA